MNASTNVLAVTSIEVTAVRVDSIYWIKLVVTTGNGEYSFTVFPKEQSGPGINRLIEDLRDVKQDINISETVS